MSAILLIIDGLGDLPTPKTALQAAKTPNLDALARNGITGLLSTISPGVPPGSDVSHLRLFGYDLEKFYPGRGPLEAMGVGLALKEGDIAFRVNLATVEGEKVVDRRAGRITTEEARRLESALNFSFDDVQVRFKSSVEHRGALVLRGPNLSPNVSDTDTHAAGPIVVCQARDPSPETTRTAHLVNKLVALAHERLAAHAANRGRRLPANAILLRSAGVYRRVPSLHDRFGIRAVCVAGGALYKGVARYVGMDIIDAKGATGTATTDLSAKARAAISASKTYDFVFLHVKAVDSFGHDGDFKGKTKMLERVDRELVAVLRKSSAALIVTGDHSTPCVRKAHSGHEVPIVVYGEHERVDGVKRFDEMACMAGGLGHLRGADVLPIVLNTLQKGKLYGS